MSPKSFIRGTVPIKAEQYIHKFRFISSGGDGLGIRSKVEKKNREGEKRTKKKKSAPVEEAFPCRLSYFWQMQIKPILCSQSQLFQRS